MRTRTLLLLLAATAICAFNARTGNGAQMVAIAIATYTLTTALTGASHEEGETNHENHSY